MPVIGSDVTCLINVYYVKSKTNAREIFIRYNIFENNLHANMWKFIKRLYFTCENTE